MSPGNRGEEVVDVAWAPDVDEVVPVVGMHVGALKLNGKFLLAIHHTTLTKGQSI